MGLQQRSPTFHVCVPVVANGMWPSNLPWKTAIPSNVYYKCINTSAFLTLHKIATYEKYIKLYSLILKFNIYGTILNTQNTQETNYLNNLFKMLIINKQKFSNCIFSITVWILIKIVFFLNNYRVLQKTLLQPYVRHPRPWFGSGPVVGNHWPTGQTQKH